MPIISSTELATIPTQFNYNKIIALITKCKSCTENPYKVIDNSLIDIFDSNYGFDYLKSLNKRYDLAILPLSTIKHYNTSYLYFNDSPNYYSGDCKKYILEDLSQIISVEEYYSKTYAVTLTLEDSYEVKEGDYLVLPSERDYSIYWIGGSTNIPPLSTTYASESYKLENVNDIPSLFRELTNKLNEKGLKTEIHGNSITIKSSWPFKYIEFYHFFKSSKIFKSRKAKVENRLDYSLALISKEEKDNRLLELTSKVKGEKANDITLEIKKYGKGYNLIIKLNNIYETHYVETSVESKYLIDEVLVNSSLISGTSFRSEYELKEGIYNFIGSYPLDEYFESSIFNNNFEYFPNFILLDSTFPLSGLPEVAKYSKDNVTQILHSVENTDINLRTDLPPDRSEYQAFYNEVYYPNDKIPSYSYFLPSLMESTFYESETLDLYIPKLTEEEKELCNSLKLNTISNDITSYFLNHLITKSKEFLIKYCLLIIKRVFYNEYYTLIGEYEDRVEEFIQSCISLVLSRIGVLITSIDFNYKVNSSIVTINLITKFKELTEKDYKLTIKLNIK